MKLLDLSFVRHLVEESDTLIKSRQINSILINSKLCGPITGAGFNPFAQAVFTETPSRFIAWKNSGFQDRQFNYKDFLVKEIFKLLHDYLHVMAYQWIHEFFESEKISFSQKPFEDVEEMAWLHLVTETAAVVGLDFWYTLPKAGPVLRGIGSGYRTFASQYSEPVENELKLFGMDLNTRHRSFFRHWCDFYSSGVLPDVPERLFFESPVTTPWLEHEMLYGATQRRYSRQWFLVMSGQEIPAKLSNKEFERPVKKPAYADRLIDQVAGKLWDFTMEERTKKFVPVRFGNSYLDYSGHSGGQDFRYLNATVVEAKSFASEESFLYYIWQRMLGLDHDHFDSRHFDLAMGKTKIQLSDRDAILNCIDSTPPLAGHSEWERNGIFYPS